MAIRSRIDGPNLLVWGALSIGCNASPPVDSISSHDTSSSGELLSSSASGLITENDSTTSAIDCSIPFPAEVARTCETFEGLELCYTAQERVILDGGKFIPGIYLADLNGDDLDDVFIVYAGPEALHVYLSVPGCGFSGPLVVTGEGTIRRADSIDANNDGLLDIIADATPDRLFLNKGQGIFSERSIPELKGRFLDSADFNNDTHPDIISVSGSQLDLLMGDGEGIFTVGAQIELDGVGTYAAAMDLNEDGHQDVVTCQVRMVNDFEEILEGAIFFGDPSLTFSTRVMYDVEAPFYPFEIASGDYNRDGHADFAAGGSVRLGDGHGQFLSTQAFPGIFNKIEQVDFNNDGLMDFLLLGSILLNRDGNFSEGFENIAKLGARAGNFNGDEFVDMISLPTEGDSTYLAFTLGVAPP